MTILPASVARGATTIGLPLRASGLQALTQVTNAGDGSNRLFLVEKRGVVRVYQNGAIKSGTFLDLRALIGDASGERGLLGLVFHPQFEVNRRLYVYYTRTGGDIVVARLRAERIRQLDVALDARADARHRAQCALQSQRRCDGVRAGRLPVHRDR